MTRPLGASRRRRGAGVTFALALGLFLAMVGTAQAQAANCRSAERADVAGAYRTRDNAVLSVLPEHEEGRYRITHFDSGRSHRLYPAGPAAFQSADDLNGETPVAYRYRFQGSKGAAPTRLTVQGPSGQALVARRLPLVEREATIQSGDVVLHGRLTLPPGRGQRFKTVVHVHGSDAVPSVGREWLPHLLASQGVATLVFDKRGTGCSTGQYVQHFGVLAEDVVAVVEWLARQPEVDPTQIGLAGFSQGGWVAPLAALREPRVKFVAVGFGLPISSITDSRVSHSWPIGMPLKKPRPTPLCVKACEGDHGAAAAASSARGSTKRRARAGARPTSRDRSVSCMRFSG